LEKFYLFVNEMGKVFQVRLFRIQLLIRYFKFGICFKEVGLLNTVNGESLLETRTDRSQDSVEVKYQRMQVGDIGADSVGDDNQDDCTQGICDVLGDHEEGLTSGKTKGSCRREPLFYTQVKNEDDRLTLGNCFVVSYEGRRRCMIAQDGKDLERRLRREHGGEFYVMQNGRVVKGKELRIDQTVWVQFRLR
jgi:hypothetical protein